MGDDHQHEHAFGLAFAVGATLNIGLVAAQVETAAVAAACRLRPEHVV
jgi:hypothetical protein